MGGHGFGGRVSDALGGDLVVVDLFAVIGEPLSRFDRAFEETCPGCEQSLGFFEGRVRGGRHRSGSFSSGLADRSVGCLEPSPRGRSGPGFETR